jgi:hypothetical protein
MREGGCTCGLPDAGTSLMPAMQEMQERKINGGSSRASTPSPRRWPSLSWLARAVVGVVVVAQLSCRGRRACRQAGAVVVAQLSCRGWRACRQWRGGMMTGRAGGGEGSGDMVVGWKTRCVRSLDLFLYFKLRARCQTLLGPLPDLGLKWGHFGKTYSIASHT